jgi:hypothetical protein
MERCWICGGSGDSEEHLFFVKAFGCKIVEGQAPIDIKSFSQGLLRCIPHPNVYIAMLPAVDMHGAVLTNSQIDVRADSSGIFAAVWYYLLDDVALRVCWFRSEAERRGYWHPKTVGKCLQITRPAWTAVVRRRSSRS